MKARFVLGICLLFMLIAVPLISATDTEINVETLSNHEVSILVLKSGETYSLLELYNNKPSGQYGNVSVLFPSSDIDKINIQVIVKQNGQQVLTKKFTDIPTGTPVSFQVLPEWIDGNSITNSSANSGNFSNLSNSTPENITTSVSKNNSGNKSVSGFSTPNLNVEFLRSKIFWTVLIIMVVAVLVIVFRNKISSVFSNGSIKFKTKGGDSVKVNTKDIKSIKRELQTTSQKLEATQKELNQYKNQDKIRDLQKNIEEQTKELQRLKGS